MTGPPAAPARDLRTALMAGVLFICLFFSANWLVVPIAAQGELIRIDTVLLFGQLNIYYLMAPPLFAAVFLARFAPRRAGLRPTQPPSFLKTLFWLFLIPLNILIYVTVIVRALRLKDLGVAPLIEFGLYLIVVYFVQEVYLEGGTPASLKDSLTFVQVLILARLAYCIVKYLLGYGMPWPGGGVRLGQENDFADYFVLLFIVGLVRLLFERGESRPLRALHAAGAGLALFTGIVSMRRYFQVEIFLALILILAVWLPQRKHRTLRPAIAVGLALSLVFGASLFVGAQRMTSNPVLGRFLTSFSLLSDRYESRFGTETGHRAEIRDGWLNVRANWLLGVTPFGAEKIRKVETREWQQAYFVHNAYLWVWMIYGLFGLALFLAFYGLSLRLGARLFFRYGDSMGLILAVFLACQLVKNVVWVTVFYYRNTTIVYLFLISLAWKADALARARGDSVPAASAVHGAPEPAPGPGLRFADGPGFENPRRATA